MAPDTPKAVSSRLLTMKFMQRAVASAASSPETESHSSKKRKLDHSPAQGRFSAYIDQAAIQAALEDQEAKRLAALEKHSAADSHWVLNTTLDKSTAGKTSSAPLNIVYVGYGDIDSSNESAGEDAPQSGRTSTRKAKATSNKKSGSEKQPGAEEDSSEDSSGESDDSSPKRKSRRPATGLSQELPNRSRSRSKSKLSQESVKAKDFREKRKKKDVRLNKITSISSGGASSSSSLTCYNCKQTGHRASSCPKGGSQVSLRKP